MRINEAAEQSTSTWDSMNRMQNLPASRAAAIGRGAAFLVLVVSMPAGAAEEQFWPEFDGYFKLDDLTRTFLRASATRAEDVDGGGAEPRFKDVTLGAHLDFTLRPFLRTALQEEDWERNRYLWMRVGYNYIENHRGDGTSYHEDRGIVELSLRQPLLDWLSLAERLKWDLRDIDGSYSNRYRVRFGLEASVQVFGHATTPYARAEFFYDTRFDTWNRERYQAGMEVTLTPHWRIEPYLVRQDRSTPNHVNALGLTVKYYH